MLMMLGIMAFGGYISYSGLDQTKANAEPAPIPRFVDVERPKEVPSISTININLKDDKVTVEGIATATVNITKKDEERTIVKWKTRIVEKPVVLDNRPMPNLVKPFVPDNKIPVPNPNTILYSVN